MTQRKKTLATSFASVADDINKNIKENEDVKENNNKNINNYNNGFINTNSDKVVNSNDSIIENMISNKPQSKKKKKLTGIYFDPDVASTLEKLKSSGKMNVSMSVFINNIVKDALIKNNLM